MKDPPRVYWPTKSTTRTHPGEVLEEAELGQRASAVSVKVILKCDKKHPIYSPNFRTKDKIFLLKKSDSWPVPVIVCAAISTQPGSHLRNILLSSDQWCIDRSFHNVFVNLNKVFSVKLTQMFGLPRMSSGLLRSSMDHSIPEVWRSDPKLSGCWEKRLHFLPHFFVFIPKPIQYHITFCTFSHV